MIRRMLVVLFLAVTALILQTGCHTAHGFGEDVESTGNSIQRHTPN
jgi:predicted small secreted protein